MIARLTPDLCVIGAGAAGLTVAAAAARLGVPVVLIERGLMGGECLNFGCVPSKALIAAAAQARSIERASRFGLRSGTPDADFDAVRRHVDGVIAAIAPTDSEERFTGLGVDVIRGTAVFRDRRTVRVGNEFEIRARRFVIAAGSAPAIPPIPGLADVSYLTNETIFALTEKPRHLVIVGAGPVGLELAQAHRRLGAAVTLVERGRPLGDADPEGAALVLDQLAREGVVIRSGAGVARVEPAGNDILVHLEGDGGPDTVTGSHLLLAVGRRPRLEDLQLAAARVRHDGDGIFVDKRLRTSNRRIYAIGDVVAGLPRFTHVASHQAALVIRHALFRLPVDVTRALVPRVVYTDPEIAEIGLSEAEARSLHRGVRALRWSLHDNDRAAAERRPHGHIKVLVTRRGEVLGVTIVAPHAGEMITAWNLVISNRLGIDAWLGLMVPYPTYSEISQRAALAFHAGKLTNPWLRRIMALLRRFG